MSANDSVALARHVLCSLYRQAGRRRRLSSAGSGLDECNSGSGVLCKSIYYCPALADFPYIGVSIQNMALNWLKGLLCADAPLRSSLTSPFTRLRSVLICQVNQVVIATAPASEVIIVRRQHAPQNSPNHILKYKKLFRDHNQLQLGRVNK